MVYMYGIGKMKNKIRNLIIGEVIELKNFTNMIIDANGKEIVLRDGRTHEDWAMSNGFKGVWDALKNGYVRIARSYSDFNAQYMIDKVTKKAKTTLFKLLARFKKEAVADSIIGIDAEYPSGDDGERKVTQDIKQAIAFIKKN